MNLQIPEYVQLWKPKCDMCISYLLYMHPRLPAHIQEMVNGLNSSTAWWIGSENNLKHMSALNTTCYQDC